MLSKFGRKFGHIFLLQISKDERSRFASVSHSWYEVKIRSKLYLVQDHNE